MTSLQAQEPIYDYFGPRRGLSNRTVTDIMADNRGLMWIATENGLNRFDGYEFISFNNGALVPQAKQLSQANICNIEKDRRGKLILQYKGLYTVLDFFDPLSFEVEKLEISLQVPGTPRAFVFNELGNVFILNIKSTGTYISHLDPVSKKFSTIGFWPEQWASNRPEVQFTALDKERFLVFDDEHGLRVLHANKKVGIRKVAHNLDLKTGPNKSRNALGLMQKHSDGNTVWLSFIGQGGMYTFSSETEILQRSTLLDTTRAYANVWEDHLGNLLFNQATFSGNYPLSQKLICLDKDGNIHDFSHLALGVEYVLSVHSDNFFKSSFIGTDTGLRLVQNTTSQVARYLYQDLIEEQRGASMRAFAQGSDDVVYIAREVKYWYALHLKSNRLDTIRLTDPLSGKPLDFNACLGIYFHKGHLWGGTGDGAPNPRGYLHQYDVAACTNRTWAYPDQFTAFLGIDSTVWLGAEIANSGGRLLHFHFAEQRFVPFVDKDGKNPFENSIIRYIQPALKGGQLWIGTENGLFLVDTALKSYQHFMRSGGRATPNTTMVPMSNNVIFNIYTQGDSLVWLGTEEGLNCLHLKSMTWRQYDTANGLADKTVASILPGKNGLWVATYNGLSFFEPDKNRSRNFYRIDGFNHVEFNRYSAFIDWNGRYYFGGVNGFNAFYPDELLKNRQVPSPILSGISFYDTHQDTLIHRYASLEDLDEIEIKYYYDYLSLHLALPLYTPTAVNHFRYRFDDNPKTAWIYLDGDRSLRLRNMIAGRYTVYIQAADPNGNWSTDTLQIKLRVRQFFFQSSLFYVLATVVLLSGGFIMVRYRLAENLRIERLRTQLASDLHDEISGLLAGIALQTELVSNELEDEGASQKLRSIVQASRGAMSKMSDIIWSIDARRDNFGDLLERMHDSADDILLPLGIAYNIHAEGIEPSHLMPAVVRQNLYFMFKEAINNASKHAQATKVDIYIGHQGTLFEMRVADNGKGLPQNMDERPLRRGQGLSNLAMRAKNINAELHFLNKNGLSVEIRMKRFVW